MYDNRFTPRAQNALRLAQAAADALLARDPGLTGCPEAAERVKELFTGAAVTFS